MCQLCDDTHLLYKALENATEGMDHIRAFRAMAALSGYMLRFHLPLVDIAVNDSQTMARDKARQVQTDAIEHGKALGQADFKAAGLRLQGHDVQVLPFDPKKLIKVLLWMGWSLDPRNRSKDPVQPKPRKYLTRNKD